MQDITAKYREEHREWAEPRFRDAHLAEALRKTRIYEMKSIADIRKNYPLFGKNPHSLGCVHGVHIEDQYDFASRTMMACIFELKDGSGTIRAVFVRKNDADKHLEREEDFDREAKRSEMTYRARVASPKTPFSVSFTALDDEIEKQRWPMVSRTSQTIRIDGISPDDGGRQIEVFLPYVR